MGNEVSELRQNWLQTQYSINALESQQSELADKIKSAITLANAPQPLRDVALLILDTGLRVGAIFTLSLRMVVGFLIYK